MYSQFAKQTIGGDRQGSFQRLVSHRQDLLSLKKRIQIVYWFLSLIPSLLLMALPFNPYQMLPLLFSSSPNSISYPAISPISPFSWCQPCIFGDDTFYTHLFSNRGLSVSSYFSPIPSWLQASWGWKIGFLHVCPLLHQRWWKLSVTLTKKYKRISLSHMSFRTGTISKMLRLITGREGCIHLQVTMNLRCTTSKSLSSGIVPTGSQANVCVLGKITKCIGCTSAQA